MKTLLVSLLLALPACVCLASAAPQQQSILQHFEAAQKYQAAGETTLAESEYRQALGLTLEKLGALLTARQKYDEAQEAYRQAGEARAGSEEASIGQGIVYLLRREAEPGIEILQKLLARSPNNDRARHLLGKLLMLAGRFKEAVNELEEVVGRNPADLGAAYTLALVVLEDRQLDAARKVFDGLTGALGDSAELRILIGRAYSSMHFLDQAVQEFQRAIELNPKAGRAHFYLGQTLLIREGATQLPAAIDLFQEELRINPNDFSANFLIGVALREQRRFAEASAALGRAVRAQPESADAHHYLGSALFSQEKYLQAVTALKKAIALTTDPSRSSYQVANTHYILSQTYRKLGRPRQAERELEQSSGLKTQSAEAASDSLETFLKTDSAARDSALSMEGKDAKGAVTLEIDLPARPSEREAAPLQAELAGTVASLYNSLALLRVSQNDTARARELFERALGWKEDLRDLRYNLALVYYNQKDYSRAVPLLEKELAARPAGPPTVRHLAALAAYQAGDFARALPLLQKVVAAKPADSEVRLALAISSLRTNRARQAETVLRGLISQNPRQAGLRVLLGQSLAQQSAYAPAAAEFTEALRLDPEAPEANYSLAMAQLRAGKFEEAERTFQKEVRARPLDARAHYHFGYLLLMRRQFDDGLKEMRIVVDLEPNYAEAHYQLGKSYFQQGRWEDARERLETAARIDPEKDYIHYQLAQTYLRLGREADAQRSMETYRRLKAGIRGQESGVRESQKRDPPR